MASAVASGDAHGAQSPSSSGRQQPDASSQIATTSAVTLDHPMATATTAPGMPDGADSGVKEEDEDAKLFTSLVNGIQNGALAAAAAASGPSAMTMGAGGPNGMFDAQAGWQPPMQGALPFPNDLPMSNDFVMGSDGMHQQPPFAMGGEMEALGPIQAYAKLEFPGFSYYIQTLDFTIGRRPAHFREQFSDQQHITGASKAEGDVDVDLGPLKSISRFHVRIFYQDQPVQQTWSPRAEGRASPSHQPGSQSSRSASAIEDERGAHAASMTRQGSSPSKANHNPQLQAQGRFVLQVLGRNGACVDDVYIGKDAIVPLGRRTKIQIAERVFYFVLPPPSTQIEALQPDINDDATHDEQMAHIQPPMMPLVEEIKVPAGGEQEAGSLGSSDEDEEEEEGEGGEAEAAPATGDAAEAEQESGSGSGDEEESSSEESGSDEEDDDDEEEEEDEKGESGAPGLPPGSIPMPTAPPMGQHMIATPNSMVPPPLAAQTPGAPGMPQMANLPGGPMGTPAPPAASTSPSAKKRKRGDPPTPEPPHAEIPPMPTPVAAPIPPPPAATPVETPTANKRKRAKKPPTTPGPGPGSMPMGGYPGMHQPMNPMGMFGSLHGGIVGPATAALLQQFSNTPAAAAALMAATGGGMNMGGQSPYSMPPHMMSPMSYHMGPPGGYGGGPPGMPMPGQMGSPMGAPGSPFYGGNPALGRGSPARMDKPDKSNVDLIREAMASPLAASRGGKMTLQEVYDYLAGTYEYFRTTTRLNGPDWHNSIRHSIQSNKSIVRIPRKKHETAGKGTFYAFAGSEAAKQHATGASGASPSDAIKAEDMSPSLRPGSAAGSPMTPGSPASLGQRLPQALGQGGMAARPPGLGFSGPQSPTAGVVRPGMPPSGSPSPRPLPGAVAGVPQQLSRPMSASPAPPGRVQVIIGRAPPAGVAQSAAAPKTAIVQKVESALGGAPIIPYEGTLYLSPQVFGRMSPTDVNNVAEKGAVQAVKALQGHLIAHLQAKLGAGAAAEGASATAAAVTTQLLSGSRPPSAGPASATPGAAVRPAGGARPPLAGARPPAGTANASGATGVGGPRPPANRPPGATGARPGQPAATGTGRPAGPAFNVPANGRPASARPPSSTIARPGQTVRPSAGAAAGTPSNRPPGPSPAATNGAAATRPGVRPATQARPPGQAGATQPASSRPPSTGVRPPVSSTAGRPAPARPPVAASRPPATGTARPPAPAAANGVARPAAPVSGAAGQSNANAGKPGATTPAAKAGSPSAPSSNAAPTDAKGSPAPAAMSPDIAQLLALLGGGKIDSGKLTPAQHELLQRAGRLAAEQQKAQQAKAAAAAAAAAAASSNGGGSKTEPAPTAPPASASANTTAKTPAADAKKDEASEDASRSTGSTNKGGDGSERPSTPPPPSPPKTRAQAAALSSPGKTGATRSSQGASAATPPKTRSAAKETK